MLLIIFTFLFWTHGRTAFFDVLMSGWNLVARTHEWSPHMLFLGPTSNCSGRDLVDFLLSVKVT